MSQELIIYNDIEPGLPSNSNLLSINAHGERDGRYTITIPDNVYIISPCVDDVQWSGLGYLSESSKNKKCNKMDYTDITAEGHPRCGDKVNIQNILKNLENLDDINSYQLYYSSQDVARLTRFKLNDFGDKQLAQFGEYNSDIQQSLSNKAMFRLFPKIKKGENMNELFKYICDQKTDIDDNEHNGCKRFCINGPGSIIKNAIYSGSHQSDERVYGRRLTMFEQSTGKRAQIVLKGDIDSILSYRVDDDPVGNEKVRIANANIPLEFEEKIVDKIDLKTIIFYYKNFGMDPFQNPNKTSWEKKDNVKPLIIFAASPCSGDIYSFPGRPYVIKSDKRYEELKEYISYDDIDNISRTKLKNYLKIFNQTKPEGKITKDSVSDLRERLKKFIENYNRDLFTQFGVKINRWLDPDDIYPQEHTIKKLPIEYDFINPRKDNKNIWDISDNNVEFFPLKYRNLEYEPSISTNLRSSTNIGSQNLNIPRGYAINSWKGRHRVYENVLKQNPCYNKRPKLNEIINDHRAVINRTKRNITSNIEAKNEVELCNTLAKIGLGVGSRLIYVIGDGHNSNNTHNYSRNPIIATSVCCSKDDKLTLTSDYLDKLEKNILPHEYDYRYFLKMISELSKISDYKGYINSGFYSKDESIKDEQFYDYNYVMLTEIVNIENNLITLKIPYYVVKSEKNSFNNLSNEVFDDFVALSTLYNLRESFSQEKKSIFGEKGRVTESIINVHPAILNNCYWNINEDLIKLFRDGEKNITRREAFKKMNALKPRYLGTARNARESLRVAKNVGNNTDHNTLANNHEGGFIDRKIQHLENYIINNGFYYLPKFILDDIENLEQ